MNDNELDDNEDGYGYADDYEAQYGAGSDDGWDMARADGCEPCGIGADELEIVVSGFHWTLICPYCGDVLDGGNITWREKVRDVWVVLVEGLRTAMARLGSFAGRSAKSGGDADNMSDIPF
jgi:hypothetical protein